MERPIQPSVDDYDTSTSEGKQQFMDAYYDYDKLNLAWQREQRARPQELPQSTHHAITTSELMARAVKVSYIYTIEGAEKAQEIVEKHFGSYVMDTSLSDDNSVVLFNPSTNNIIIAYRGTVQPTQNAEQSAKDYYADAQIAVSAHKFIETARMREAQDKYERARVLYPDANIRVAGHSLGGMQSYHVATKNNVDGHHFAVGTGLIEEPINMIQRWYYGDEEAYSRQRVYHATRTNTTVASRTLTGQTGNDPISAGSINLPGKHVFLPIQTWTDFGAHSMTYWYSLDD